MFKLSICSHRVADVVARWLMLVVVLGGLLGSSVAGAQTAFRYRHACKHGLAASPGWDGLYTWLRFQRACFGGATFEFAPASGAGMGTNYCAVNWLPFSEQFDNASWSKLSAGAGVTPTVTPNVGVAPDGTTTADRVQFSACPGGTDRSIVYRNNFIAGYDSIYLKGFSGSGTISMGMVPYVTTCSFNPTTWTRCELAAVPGTATNIIFGCDRLTSPDTGAADVLMWGAMEAGNPGATYISTAGGTATGFTPTGSKGETMTFSRASTAYCSKTNSTDGTIANGDLVLVPSGAPRVQPMGYGDATKALFTEGAATNLILRSEEFENASWLKGSAVTGGVPTVTANAATAPNNTSTADRLQVPACSGATGASLVYQDFTAVASQIYTGSVYVKGNGAAYSFALYRYNITSAVGSATVCNVPANGWVRCAHTWTQEANTTARFGVGCQNDSTVVGATALPASDVFAWGAQVEVGYYPSSYIPTVGATAARVGDAAYFDLGVAAGTDRSDTVKSFAANYRYSYINGVVSAYSGPMAALDTIGSPQPPAAIAVNSGANMPACYEGGYVAPYYGGNYNDRVACNWSQNTLSMANGAGLSNVATSTPVTPWRYISIGSINGQATYNQSMTTSQVCVDTLYGTCTRDPSAITYPYADFEFAPVPIGGVSAGMGNGPCPAPNWLPRSQELDVAPWQKQGSGAAAPTVTANAATAPDGTLTAEQVDFPLTNLTDISWIYQAHNAAPCLNGNGCLVSFYAKSVIGTVAIDVCQSGGGSPTCVQCSFISSSSWTRCSATFTNGGAVASLYIGHASQFSGLFHPPQSVYLWGAQIEPSSPTAPGTYVPTSATATGFKPTGAKGETMTFSQAGNTYCSKTTGPQGSFTLSGIQNGDLVLYPPNVPRIEYQRPNQLGIRLERSVTNTLVRSQEFENAAWTKEQGGSGAPALPVVVANAATAPDGTLTADRITFDATSGTGFSDVYQPATPAATNTCSFYVKGVSGSGTTDVASTNSGGGGTVVSTCVFNASTWTRCSVANSTGTAGVWCKIGNNSNQNGGIARSVSDVYVWGAQFEAGVVGTGGDVVSSYVPTGAATATKAVDQASITFVNPRVLKALSLGISVNYRAHNADSGWLGAPSLATAALVGYSLPGENNLFVGTSKAVILANGVLSYGTHRFTGGFDSGASRVFTDGAIGTGAGIPGPTSVTGLIIGDYNGPGGTRTVTGVYARICLDEGSNRCVGTDPEPLFEFAPTGYTGTTAGLGMPATACDGTFPTGTKGEPLVFSRASTAMCSKGSLVSGIQNGDMVQIASSIPRIMPGGDGTGGLGIMVEGSKTNSALRSQEFENAAWTKAAVGSAVVPVVTADQGVAPDGTSTADRVQYASCANSGDASYLNNASAMTAQAGVFSVYVKGTSTSGSMSLCTYAGGGPGVDGCSVCSYNASTWTRCSRAASNASTATVAYGCVNQPAFYGGASNTGAADVLLWGAQWEAGAYPTTYIPTSAATATRAAETAAFANVGFSPQTSGSMSAQLAWFQGPAWTGTDSTALNLSAVTNALGALPYFNTSGGPVFGAYSVTAGAMKPLTNAAFLSAHRYGVGWTGSSFTSYLDGTAYATSTLTAPSSTWVNLQLGDYNGSHQINSVIKGVCVDQNAGRCIVQNTGPFFELAPVSGAGLVTTIGTTASTCDTTASITGSKGEPVTFTRVGTATCVKGNNVSGIQNGDLVIVPSGVPRIMPGGDGTGGNGIMFERARTNLATYSEQFNNAAWTKAATQGSITVTADQGTAPDGTLTADRIQFPAITGVGQAIAFFTPGAGVPASGSVYLKGYNGTSGTLDLWVGPGPGICVQCPYNGTTWTRCASTTTTTGNYFAFGNDTQQCTNATSRPAADVLAWGGQYEQGSYPSTYIPTVGSTVTRNQEYATIDLGAGAPTAGKIGFSFKIGGKPAVNNGLTTVPVHLNSVSFADGTGRGILIQGTTNSTSFFCNVANDASVSYTTGTAPLLSGNISAWCGLSAVGAALNGATDLGTMAASGATAGTFSPARYLSLGAINTITYQPDAVIKQVCVDGDYTRCQPTSNYTKRDPLFEFLPGSSTIAACDPTATVAGTRGEVLTFTRASAATCLKNNTSANGPIQNGDMVVMLANQPRIMPGGDGTGGNGLMMESARTNYLLNSAAIGSTGWAGSGTYSPTVVANQAVAPDGTTTAEDISFHSVTSGQYTSLYQGCPTGVTNTGSLYLRAVPDAGVSGGSQIELCFNTPSLVCTLCNYDTTGWRRCTLTQAITSNGQMHFGNLNFVGEAAKRVLAWGAQCETGPYATSYIPTQGATATRVIEAASFPAPAMTTGSDFSVAFTVSSDQTLSGCATGWTLVSTTNGFDTYSCFGTGAWFRVIQGANTAESQVVNAIPGAAYSNNRFWLSWDRAGSKLTATANGQTPVVSAATPAVGTAAFGTTVFRPIDGVVKKICYDQTAGKCR